MSVEAEPSTAHHNDARHRLPLALNTGEQAGEFSDSQTLETQSAPASATSSPSVASNARGNTWLLGVDGADEAVSTSLKFLKDRCRSYHRCDPNQEGSHRRTESESRPALIRKKSGELVKSSLKLPTLARPRSMPNTKNVHFDTNLEHVRRFNYREKPNRVSFECGGGDDSDLSESDNEFDYNLFSSTESFAKWNIITPNFTPPNYDYVEGPRRPVVYLENLFLSPDHAYLKGNIGVRNIAFGKRVVVRYTIDYWQTLSEVEAHFNADIKKLDKAAGYDRFTFQIPLGILPDRVLRKASMFLCVRYNVDGKVHWDNNSNLNYEVVFTKGDFEKPRFSWPHSDSVPSRFVVSPKYSSRDDYKWDDSSDHPLRARDDIFRYDDFETTLPSTPSEIFASVAVETKDGKRNSSNNKGTTTKVNSELKSRYSFGTAFNASLKFHKPVESPKHSTDKAKGVTNSTAATANGSPNSSKKSTSNRVFPVTGTSQLPWDSTSYQDMLSKYCFAGSQSTGNGGPGDNGSGSSPDRRSTEADKPAEASSTLSPDVSPTETTPESSPMQVPASLPKTTSYSSLPLMRPASVLRSG